VDINTTRRCKGFSPFHVREDLCKAVVGGGRFLALSAKGRFSDGQSFPGRHLRLVTPPQPPQDTHLRQDSMATILRQKANKQCLGTCKGVSRDFKIQFQRLRNLLTLIARAVATLGLSGPTATFSIAIAVSTSDSASENLMIVTDLLYWARVA
jgi:hypothetical protein